APGAARRLLERAVPSISEEPGRPEGVGDKEIRPSVAIYVSGGHTGRGYSPPVCGRETRFHGDISEVSVAVVLVEDRANSVRDEEILEAVAVVVEHRDAGARPDVRDQVVDELQRRIVAGSAGAAVRGPVSKSGRVGGALVDVLFEGNPDAEWCRVRFGHGIGLELSHARIAPRIPLGCQKDLGAALEASSV